MRKSILIFLFALLGVLSAWAYDFEVGGIYYNRISGTDGQVEVTYKELYEDSYSGSVVIPSTVTYDGNTYSVTSIGWYAFRDCSGLTSVTIPNSVTSIGERAFWGCSGLTSVTIPEGVTSIGNCAFSECSGLTSVTFPESVDTIGHDVFWGANSIKKPLYNSKIFAYMPRDYNGEYVIQSGIQSIAANAFEDCRGLTSVTLPNSVTTIGYYAFYNCSGLTSVTIPNGVTYIEWDAFSGCSGLTSVTIPESVTYIGREAFKNCSGLTSLTIPNSVTAIVSSAFSGCSGLTSVTIPNSVTSIGSSAFENCSGLTSVTIPESVTSIGNSVFRGCGGLTSVTIPQSVTSIGSSAFYECSGLTSVTIPNSVTSIGDYAFYNCSGLTSVTSLAETPPTCGSSVFSVHDTLLVPRGCKAAYQKAEKWSNFTTIYESGFDGTGLITVLPNDTTMGRVTGGGEYEIDKEITIEAIPNAGYHFVKWDDENTNNPRTLKVIADITFTAIFEKNADPTLNENSEADNFRVYVQDRTIYLSENRGSVQVYNMAGQCVYNGHATAISVPQSGVYILRVADGRSRKVLVK